MKSQRNILIAFILNLIFSAFEFAGGLLTGSFAIMSDALHDLGDAAGIGVSYFFEKKSTRKPDEKYTYGYTRYSLLGSLIMTTILITGSAVIIYNAVCKLIYPTSVNYNGMIILAVIGCAVNLVAAMITNHSESLNQKAVNLHLLEDVLGWAVVLVGAVFMKFTNLSIIDPVLSIAVALFVLINAVKTLIETLNILLEKSPENISVSEIKEHISKIDGVIDVHHIHLWSLNVNAHLATMHIVAKDNIQTIKEQVKEELRHHNISHSTIEFETPQFKCSEYECIPITSNHTAHHHHH